MIPRDYPPSFCQFAKIDIIYLHGINLIFQVILHSMAALKSATFFLVVLVKRTIQDLMLKTGNKDQTMNTEHKCFKLFL